jgi:AcrR family transcriptional regulator
VARRPRQKKPSRVRSARRAAAAPAPDRPAPVAAPAADAARLPENRREALLNEAARLFGTRGFAATSTRDIAAAVGMLPGSIYYHFPSKEALALAVHERGVSQILRAVRAALDGVPEDAPWERFEAACVAHLEALLTGSEHAQVVTPQFARALPPEHAATLIRQRDAYERLFADLVDALPLPRGASRRYLRLAVLGSLNWALTWYRPDGDAPATIAKRIVDLYRRPLDAGP